MISVEQVLRVIYGALMGAASLWCHQMPERSPHLFGAQMPLCWRCTGVLAGTLIFFLWLWRRERLLPFHVSLLLALAMPLDVACSLVAHAAGDNTRRLLTGLLWGVFGTSAVLHLVRRLVALRGRLRSPLAVARAQKRFSPKKIFS